MTRTWNAKGQGARLRDDILEAGMVADLRLTKPELPWPAAEELIDATLVRLGVGQGGGAVGPLHP